MKANTLEMFLYQTRESLKMSVKDLASKVGVTERTIRNWENPNDKRQPKLSYLYKLLLILNISIDDMLE